MRNEYKDIIEVYYTYGSTKRYLTNKYRVIIMKCTFFEKFVKLICRNFILNMYQIESAT